MCAASATGLEYTKRFVYSPVRIANYQRAEHPVPRGFAMARPEPGTPRFSVRRSKPSKWAKSLEASQFRPGDRDHPMFAVCRYLSPFVGMASGPDPGLAPRLGARAVRAASVPELERGFRHAGYVGRSPLARVGRQRALLREAGYERGVGADDCFSSGAGESSRPVKTRARYARSVVPSRARSHPLAIGQAGKSIP